MTLAPGADLPTLLRRTAEHIGAYRAGLPGARVYPTATLEQIQAGFEGPLPLEPTPAEQVLDRLVAAATPGLVASAGPRYFGFVVGGSLPAATCADLLATGWDQVAFNAVSSPAAAAAEETAGAWLAELLGLPAGVSVGFVTGGQAANTVALAAARHHVLAQAGWDVERDGLQASPRVRVLAGAERHATIDRALRLLGLGTAALTAVPATGTGAIDVDALAVTLEEIGPGPTVVCLQAGNVNTGAFDELGRAIDIAHRHGAWVHVDGAFGLWAAANPATRHLVDGLERADSWACDGHKWLNVPYDSGYTFCAHPSSHAAAMSFTAAYLTGQGSTGLRHPSDYVPESSRRARGFATWGGLLELGSSGVARLVENGCALARRFAAGLSEQAGVEVVNDVVLNQVLVDFGSPQRTDAVVAAVQREGTCWLGATTWQGRRLMRISVSGHATTEADVDASVAAILAAARAEPAVR